ncbi:MAG: PAS domain-containing protein [Pseudomonadota bacterium]
MPFQSIVNNIALLLALCIIYELILRKWRHSANTGRVLSGILFGLIAVAGMTNAFVLQPGVIFDGRTVVISVSGLFLGPITAVISSCIAATYRLWLGGPGAFTGVMAVFTGTMMGIAGYLFRSRQNIRMTAPFLLIFGIIVHAVLLLVMYITLPAPINSVTLDKMALPFLTVLPLGTLILGKLLENLNTRLQIERDLEESRTRLSLALSSADQGLYDLNILTGEAIISPEYATMLGYDPIAFGMETNQKWIKRLHPEDMKRVSRVYLDYIEGRHNEYKVEFRQRTRDGDWKWILSLGKIVERDNTGTPLRMIGTHTDITNIKKVESELRDSRELFRSFMQNLPGIAMIKDRDRRFIFLNERFDEVTGINGEKLLGKTGDELLSPEIALRLRQNEDTVFSLGKTIAEEHQFSLNGNIRSYMTYFFPIAQGSQSLIGILAFDVTARKRAQEELQKAHFELEKRVAERTAELQRTVNLMADREIRMSELKNTINLLQQRLDSAARSSGVNKSDAS